MIEQPWYAQAGFSDDEWGLLVGLPQSVLTAASAAQQDSTRRTMAETAAGHEAIAAARLSPNPLVAAVATEIVARVGDPEAGEELPPIDLPDPGAAVNEALERAQAAAGLLARFRNSSGNGTTVGEGDATAYRHWLVEIADQVLEAAPAGGVLGVGGELITPAERRFRDRLAEVLAD